MKSVWTISLFFFVLTAQAQPMDTAVMKAFELIASKPVSNTGAVRINMPLESSGSMAEVLSQNSALFVKSYSPGNLASTSMRGMGAQHTAVLWNGINLQSSMNSNIDLNLLPAFFFEKASIETGANASAAANGTIAGAIYLNNELAKRKSFYGELMQGSFGQQAYSGGFSFYKGKWISNTRFIFRSADNDFEFTNYFLPGKPLEKLRNSAFNQSGLMQEIKLELNKSHSIYANYWYLQTSRDLPPAMGIVNTNNEHQDDYSSKLIIKHEGSLGAKTELNSYLAFISEEINYYNDLLSPAFNNSYSLISESMLKWKVNSQLELATSLNYTMQNASTDGYINGRERHLVTLWTGMHWNSKNKLMKLSFGNRQIMSSGVMMPSSPDIGAELKLNKKWKLKGNVAAGFRIPSFNDLFWLAGGNQDLKPEVSRKSEISTEFKSGDFSSALTAFYHHVNDWILWSPDPSSQIWRASNAKTVESKGIELASEYKLTFSKFHHVKFFGRYQFVRSVNSKVYLYDSSSLGKQLFYTPQHTGFIQMRYQYGNLRFSLGTVYTGSVFTTADNTLDNVLEAYTIFNTAISYQLTYKKHMSILSFSVNNIGNKTYQVIENRPMPLRNYQISIKFNINYE